MHFQRTGQVWWSRDPGSGHWPR